MISTAALTRAGPLRLEPDGEDNDGEERDDSHETCGPCELPGCRRCRAHAGLSITRAPSPVDRLNDQSWLNLRTWRPAHVRV